MTVTEELNIAGFVFATQSAVTVVYAGCGPAGVRITFVSAGVGRDVNNGAADGQLATAGTGVVVVTKVTSVFYKV